MQCTTTCNMFWFNSPCGALSQNYSVNMPDQNIWWSILYTPLRHWSKAKSLEQSALKLTCLCKPEMARAEGGGDRGSNPAAFFFSATLFLWAASIAFVITFNGRRELTVIAVGFFFFQTANFVIRRFISKDPLLVNTSVSLLHSSLISASGRSSYLIALLLFCL